MCFDANGKSPLVAGLVVLVEFASAIACMYIGAAYDDCPPEPNMPTFLIVLGVTSLLSLVVFMAYYYWETPHRAFLVVAGVVALFYIIWIIVGSVWVWSISGDFPDTECDKTLQIFSIAELIWGYVKIGVGLPCVAWSAWVARDNQNRRTQSVI